MSRNMFTLYYNNKTSMTLFKILCMNGKVRCIDKCRIERDVTNECIGTLFFIEGPTIFVNLMCKLSGMVVSNGKAIYVRTKNNKIIGEEES